MKIVKIHFIIYLLVSTHVMGALDSSSISMELSTFLEKAKENDPQIQTIVAERLKAKYLMDLNLPTRQILLSVQNEYGFTRNEENTSILSAVISKPILESGTVVSVGKTLTERPDRDEDVTEMRIEQALYRNAFGSLIRKKKENLSEQESIIELQVIEAYEDYIEQVIHNYLDLTLSYLNYQTAQRLHQDAKVLLKNVKKRKAKNIASSTDLSRAELQTALRHENELQSRVALETQSRGVLRVIGDIEAEIVLPETLLNMEKKLANIDQSIDTFLTSSRSKIIYDKQEAVARENLAIVKEGLKPAANLLVGFNIDRSRRFSTTINREEAVVGVNIDIPFDHSLVQAQIKETSYLLLKSKLAKKSFDNAIRESLFVIKNKILRQRQQLEISKKKKELAAKIVAEENKRYQFGRITLEDLILDKNILAQYEFSYLYELTVLNKLIIQWLGLTDQLIDKNEVISKSVSNL